MSRPDGGDLGTGMRSELREVLCIVDRTVRQLATECPLVALKAVGHLETLIESEAPAAAVAA